MGYLHNDRHWSKGSRLSPSQLTKDGHGEHPPQRFQWVSVAGPRRKRVFTSCFSMIDSTLARVPRTSRDKRVVDRIVSGAFKFATCGTINLVGYKAPITKLSWAMKAWQTLLYSSHVQLRRLHPKTRTPH